MAASAASPTVVQDIYSTTKSGRSGDGTALISNYFPWCPGAADSKMSAFPGLMGDIDLDTLDSLEDGVFQDIDGVTIGWDSANNRIIVNCPDGKLGHLEVRVFNLNGIQLAYQSLSDSTSEISLNQFVPDYYLVVLTEDGKLIKTTKLHLK